MRFLLRIASVFCLALLFGSCKKDHGIFGLDVQPKGDAFNNSFSDTTSIYAFTVKNDSTANNDNQYRFLGSNLDPNFGRLDAGLYVNSNMNLTNLDFGGDATIRSSEIILAVDVANFIGLSTSQLTYSVFAVDSLLSPYNLAERLYYTSNARLHSKRRLLSTFTASFTLYNGKTVLRIPISPDYANAILTNPTYLTDNVTFQNTYRGFYITTEGTSLNAAAPGIIYTCNLQDDVSGFYLYYQNGTASATKADKNFKFLFSGSTAVRYNTVKYQPAQGGSSNLVQQIVAKDSTAGREDLYLLGLGATKVKFYLPYLKNYSDSSQISVSRAELVLHLDPNALTGVGQYIAPPNLAVLPLDSLGRETYDAYDEVDNARYDGSYDDANKRYVFNIARLVQGIANGTIKNHGFYISIANTSLFYPPLYNAPAKEMILLPRDNDMRRVVLAGSNKGDLKPKLNLNFVRLKGK